MINKERLTSLVVPALALVALVAAGAGCSSQAATSPQEEAAYKEHDKTKMPTPPPDANTAKGPSFIGQPHSISIGGQAPAEATPSNIPGSGAAPPKG